MVAVNKPFLVVRRIVLSFFVLSFAISQSLAAGLTEAQIEAWLNNDTDELPVPKIKTDSTLKFLLIPPKKKVHHHHNTLFVSEDSLHTGWVKLNQCHTHLDVFPRAQILYRKGQVRNLRITVQKNIDQAWLKKNTVQLRNIHKNAKLCVEFESKALAKNKDGSYTLKSGPFMRRFLDGFFPMRVSLNINLPRELKFVTVRPQQQAGFHVNQSKSGLSFDTWFEGKFYPHIKLRKTEYFSVR